MKLSQTQQILAYLEQGHSITPLEALTVFGCFRLGARIWDIKAMGYNVVSELVKENGKHFSKYYLFCK